MPNPYNLSHIGAQSVNDTSGHHSLIPNSSSVGFTPLNETNIFVNHHGIAPLNPSPESQTTQRLLQLGLHQHSTMSRFQRSNLTMPLTTTTHTLIPHHPKIVNISIALRNSSSFTINLLNNNAPPQLTMNNIGLHASSCLEPVCQNVFTSHLNHSFPNLPSTATNILEISNTTQVLACQTNKIPNSSLHQMPSFNPYQGIRFQHHSISQSNANSTCNNLPSTFLAPCTINISAKGKEINFNGGDDTFQTSLPTYFESPSATQVHKPDPTTNTSFLPSTLPLKNERMTMTQSNQVQTKGPKQGTHLGQQVRKGGHSRERRKSKPYIKYGPYTCPYCQVIFESQYRFAAHMQSHYKDESVGDRKKRREAKIRKRELKIAESASGITIVPRSHQEEEDNKGKMGNGVFAPKIKQEVISDYMN